MDQEGGTHDVSGEVGRGQTPHAVGWSSVPGNDPFWGFETVRGVMARQGRAPAAGAVITGVLLLAIGIMAAHRSWCRGCSWSQWSLG